MSRIVIVSNGPAMNPHWWTKERCEVIKKADPIAYQTDVLAQFADAPEQLYPQELMRRCIPRGVTAIPYEPGHDYEAGMDPATRTNAWTLVIATRTGPVKRLVRACEWRGSPTEPLKSRAVLREAAAILAEYHLDWVRTDQWAADPLIELAADLKGSDRGYDGPREIVLVEEPMDRPMRVKAYNGMRTEMDDGRLMLLDVPMLRKDLKFVRRATTQAGPDIVLVKTPDGRHADFGPATVRAVSRWLLEDTKPPPDKGTAEYLDWIDEQMAEQELCEIVSQAQKPWWDKR